MITRELAMEQIRKRVREMMVWHNAVNIDSTINSFCVSFTPVSLMVDIKSCNRLHDCIIPLLNLTALLHRQ